MGAHPQDRSRLPARSCHFVTRVWTSDMAVGPQGMVGCCAGMSPPVVTAGDCALPDPSLPTSSEEHGVSGFPSASYNAVAAQDRVTGPPSPPVPPFSGLGGEGTWAVLDVGSDPGRGRRHSAEQSGVWLGMAFRRGQRGPEAPLPPWTRLCSEPPQGPWSSSGIGHPRILHALPPCGCLRLRAGELCVCPPSALALLWAGPAQDQATVSAAKSQPHRTASSRPSRSWNRGIWGRRVLRKFTLGSLPFLVGGLKCCTEQFRDGEWTVDREGNLGMGRGTQGIGRGQGLGRREARYRHTAHVGPPGKPDMPPADQMNENTEPGGGILGSTAWGWGGP